MEAIAVPAALKRLSGRIVDLDSHEVVPAQLWASRFGPELEALAQAYAPAEGGGETSMRPANFPGDVMPVGPDIGDVKGALAPGGVDPVRRLEVMDALGIRGQLMFPSGVGILGFTALIGKVHPALRKVSAEPRAFGRRLVEIYNDWAFEAARISQRLRPVAPLAGDTPEELCANARRIIDKGVRAVWLASGALPGGVSPAHPDLDPLWAMLAEAGVAATLHGGGEGHFLHTYDWKKAPAFAGYRSTEEFDFDPWSMSVYHLPSQNFITTLIFGGVFERHPALRFGVIEVGSHWVGPMMEGLDLLYRAFRSPNAFRLSRKPSDYMRTNVRVSVLVYEEIDVWMERHPALQDVLCFSTDYPHPEGGRGALQRLHDRIARLGDEVVEKFFVTNGELLLPADGA
jgi:predicted TIM-barrel fold metal-dependent hydrolase